MRNSIITVGMSGPAFTITQENFNSGEKVSSSQITTQSHNGLFVHAPQVVSLVNTFLAARPVPHMLVVSMRAEVNLETEQLDEIVSAVRRSRSEEMA